MGKKKRLRRAKAAVGKVKLGDLAAAGLPVRMVPKEDKIADLELRHGGLEEDHAMLVDAVETLKARLDEQGRDLGASVQNIMSAMPPFVPDKADHDALALDVVSLAQRVNQLEINAKDNHSELHGHINKLRQEMFDPQTAWPEYMEKLIERVAELKKEVSRQDSVISTLCGTTARSRARETTLRRRLDELERRLAQIMQPAERTYSHKIDADGTITVTPPQEWKTTL